MGINQAWETGISSQVASQGVTGPKAQPSLLLWPVPCLRWYRWPHPSNEFSANGWAMGEWGIKREALNKSSN